MIILFVCMKSRNFHYFKGSGELNALSALCSVLVCAVRGRIVLVRALQILLSSKTLFSSLYACVQAERKASLPNVEVASNM